MADEKPNPQMTSEASQGARVTGAIDPDQIDSRLLGQNFYRFSIAPIFAVPIHLAHIAFIGWNLAAPGTVERAWGIGLIVAHSALLLLISGVGVIARVRRRSGRPDGFAAWLLVDLIVLTLLLAGVVIALLDQIVTPAITPFLVMGTLVAVVVLLPPMHAFLAYGIAYGAFFWLLPWTQHDAAILLSNRANGLTVVGLGALLSLILWRTTRAGAEQHLIIEAQRAELARRNRDLSRQAEALQTLNATKDKLFSIIAHDLKNPFQSIIGMSEMLRDGSTSATKEEIEGYAASIHAAALRSHDLLDNLLHWARMQQGALGFAPRRLSLDVLVDGVLGIASAGAEQKGISIDSRVAAGASVFADADMLQTILRNLVGNAIKFTKPGGSIQIRATCADGEVRIEVTDSGVGIRPEQREKLLAASGNLSSTGTENETGSGIGLLLCREFVERHGGRLEIDSALGEGSTFAVVLPDACR